MSDALMNELAFVQQYRENDISRQINTQQLRSINNSPSTLPHSFNNIQSSFVPNTTSSSSSSSSVFPRLPLSLGEEDGSLENRFGYATNKNNWNHMTDDQVFSQKPSPPLFQMSSVPSVLHRPSKLPPFFPPGPPLVLPSTPTLSTQTPSQFEFQLPNLNEMTTRMHLIPPNSCKQPSAWIHGDTNMFFNTDESLLDENQQTETEEPLLCNTISHQVWSTVAKEEE